MSAPSSGPKLPKFLQNKNRDRSKSVNQAQAYTGQQQQQQAAASAPEVYEPQTPAKPRKSSKFSSGENYPESNAGSSSLSVSTSSRSDLPTRLSGWFSHTFSTSSTDLSLPAILSQSPSPTSRRTAGGGVSALLTAAKHGKGHLDKAVRYLLDSDSTPDKSTEPIWLCGVKHPGWSDTPSPQPTASAPPSSFRRGSFDSSSNNRRLRSSASSSSSGHSNDRSLPISLSQSTSSATPSPSPPPLPPNPNAVGWPPSFYADFQTRVWLTYRSGYTSPIRDERLTDLEPCCLLLEGDTTSITAPSSSEDYNYTTASVTKKWGWIPVPHLGTGGGSVDSKQRQSSSSPRSSHSYGSKPSSPSPSSSSQSHSNSSHSHGHHQHPYRNQPTYPTSNKTWSSDAGWGCMLRTGQSVLANALVNVWIGRDWRLPPDTPPRERTRRRVRVRRRRPRSDSDDNDLASSTQSHSTSRSPAPSRIQHSVSSSTTGTTATSPISPSQPYSSSPFGHPQHHLQSKFPSPPSQLAEYITHTQIVALFLDTPHPSAPFSVHRMALAGKDLGTQVGTWFGPSIAAGAIKTLVNAYPECGIGVSVGVDGQLFQTDVYKASWSPPGFSPAGGEANQTSRRSHQPRSASWGDRPVLVLLGLRLGIDGVNPIYYDTIKALYTFPQSVGIAGGRPSSSYYFVGSQGDNLFYLDPHHTRPTVPLRVPPPAPGVNVIPEVVPQVAPRPQYTDEQYTHHRDSSFFADTEGPKEKDKGKGKKEKHKEKKLRSSTSNSNSTSTASSASVPSSSRSHHPRQATSTTGYAGHMPLSPSPLHQQHFSSPGAGAIPRSASPDPNADLSLRDLMGVDDAETDPEDPEYVYKYEEEEERLAPLQEFYLSAYSAAEIRTFHCERVRKMHLSGLDPSMLVGFLCRTEEEWLDFRRRVGELPRTIFSILDEPPNWPSDSDDNMGLESMSDPDDLVMPIDDDEDEDVNQDDDDGEQFFDSRSTSASLSTSSSTSHPLSATRRKSEEEDSEDPADPITPGPTTTRFDVAQRKDPHQELEEESFLEGEDIEDDWVETIPSPSASIPPPPPPPKNTSKTNLMSPSNGASIAGRSSKKPNRKQIPVPVPLVKVPSTEHYPFPVTRTGAGDETPPTAHPTRDRDRTLSREKEGGKTRRMHNARARDGGRTQSGGVKGVLTDG